MKKCNKCKLEYTNDINFCKKCGNELEYFESKEEKRARELLEKKIKATLIVVRYIIGIAIIIGCIFDKNGFGFHSFIGILFGISLLPIVHTLIFNIDGIKKNKIINKLKKAIQIIVPTLLGILWIAFQPSEPLKEININDDGRVVAVTELYTIDFSTNLPKVNKEEFEYTSSNPEVASVENGIITGKTAGTVTITIKGSNSVETTAQYIIKYIEIEKVDFSGDLKLIVGNSGKIIAKTIPEAVSDKIVKWESSNPEIVSIDNNGNVTANAKGTATITVTSEKGKTFTTQVRSFIEVTSLELSKTSLRIEKGKTSTITIKALPADVDTSEITWSSSNPSVASVENGIITGKVEGTTTITAKSLNDVTATASVEIYEIKPESIKLSKTKLTLNVGQKSTISATVYPSNASDKKVSWTTSNYSVANVENGVITAKGIGTATITARTSNGKSEIIEVIVKKKAPIKINNFRYYKDSVCGVEWNFSITNNSGKTINYITMKWYNLNSVGDFAYDQISKKNYTQLRYTGPLKAGKNSGSMRNTTKFYSCSYKSSAFTEFIIEYDDFTSETINSSNMKYYSNLY